MRCVHNSAALEGLRGGENGAPSRGARASSGVQLVDHELHAHGDDAGARLELRALGPALIRVKVPNNGGRPDLGAALSAVVVELLFVSLDRLTTTIS